MDSTGQLAKDQSKANQAIEESLASLLQSYPLAMAYQDKPKYKERLKDDKYSYRLAISDLFAVRDRTSKALKEAKSTNARLVASTERWRKLNGKELAGLQRRTNAAEGAMGLYDDVRLMYNTRLLQSGLLVVGAIGMVASLALEE